MFDTIFGLPTHALIVHAVVVGLPLAAIGGLLIAVWPRVRARFGVLVAVVAVAMVPAVFVAQQSGEQLQERVNATLGPGAASAREGQLLNEHVDIGSNLLPWAIVLAVGVVIVVAVPALRLRRNPPDWLRPAAIAGSVLSVVGAVLTLYWVIRIGDAGARAAWSDVVDAAG